MTSLNLIKRNIADLDVYYIKNDKFKTIEAFFVFSNDFSEKFVNESTFLTEILSDSTKKYPSTEKFKLVCDNLYGLSKMSHYHFEGSLDITMFAISSVNDKYLPEKHVFNQAFDILLEMIYAPKTVKAKFTKKIVKEKLSQAFEMLLSIKQNKNAYSYNQFMKAYLRNNTDHIGIFPNEEGLRDFTQESLTKVHQRLTTEDNLKIFIAGDFDFSEMDNLIETKSQKIRNRSKKEFAFKPFFRSKKELDTNIVIDKTSSGQTRVFIGYDLNFPHNQENAMTMALFNELFGGFENSLLFSNIREKLHLSYYVFSHYSVGNHLFYINLETTKDNADKAINEVKQQLLNCQNGEIDEVLFIQAKNNIINRWQTAVDSQVKTMLYNIIDFFRYENIFDETEKIKMLENITKADLIKLINSINLDTIYIYTSGE